jgi:hypothetical protein
VTLRKIIVRQLSSEAIGWDYPKHIAFYSFKENKAS